MGITDWLKGKTPGPWPFTMPVRDFAKYQKLLVRDANLVDAGRLREWRWLFDDSYRPILATACGGLFLERAGAIHWLDDAMGELTQVATNAKEFEKAASKIDNFILWFKPELIHNAELAHRCLLADECFSYTIPPAVGGKYEPQNFMPTPLHYHLQLHGQMHRQFKELPTGARIRRFDVKRTSEGFSVTVVTDRDQGLS